MNRTRDIVIIGGGISGCSIAYNLAKRKAGKITLVERDYIGSGSTGRCGAGVRMQWGTEMNCLLAKYSIEFFERAKEELGYSRDLEFKQKGYLLIAATPKEELQFRKNIKLQNRLGIPSRSLTPSEAKYLVPLLNEEKITLAAYCEKDGHLNPFHATQAFAEAAKRLGVEILTHTEVAGIISDRGRIREIETNRGKIYCGTAVNAAGGYAGQIGRMAGADIPVEPERHQILVTEPVAPVLDPMVMSFSLNLYCQQTPHGSFIMGRGDDREEAGYSVNSDWSFPEKMAESCCSLMPPLSALRILRQWSGLYENTPDRQPIFGPAEEVEGFFLACGFSGHGFMLSPVTGLITSQLIMGEKPEFPVEKLGIKRFRTGELVYEPSVV